MTSCLYFVALIVVAGAAPEAKGPTVTLYRRYNPTMESTLATPEPPRIMRNSTSSLIGAGPSDPKALQPKITTTESIVTTTESTEIIRNATSPIGTFRKGFASYEKRMRLIIENMRQSCMAMYSDNVEFVDGLNQYLDRLPSGTKNVTQRYRPRCYCEDQWHSPCPERCMDSCYIVHYQGYVRNSTYTRDNCSQESDTDLCFCYKGSTDTCNHLHGGLSNCYKYKTAKVPVDQSCMQFAPNRTALEASHSWSFELLMQPLKKLVRNLDFQLGYLKKAVVATDLFNDLTTRLCADQTETSCLPEATTFLTNKLALYKQLQRNLTLESIKTQDQVEKVEKDINDMNEKTLIQINSAIKNYTCCQTGLAFSAVDNECDQQDEVSNNPKSANPKIDFRQEWTNPDSASKEVDLQKQAEMLRNQLQDLPCTARGDFLCDNKICIPQSYRCDGPDDCGDESDEANCAIF